MLFCLSRDYGPFPFNQKRSKREKRLQKSSWKFRGLLEIVKTESARRWSNKWTKTLYQDYLHCIANFCRVLLIIFTKQFISSNTKRRKRMLNFVWNTWKFWWSETDDEILPVFPQNHWTLKFIFSRSRGKLFFGVISGNYLCI